MYSYHAITKDQAMQLPLYFSVADINTGDNLYFEHEQTAYDYLKGFSYDDDCRLDLCKCIFTTERVGQERQTRLTFTIAIQQGGNISSLEDADFYDKLAGQSIIRIDRWNGYNWQGSPVVHVIPVEDRAV